MNEQARQLCLSGFCYCHREYKTLQSDLMMNLIHQPPLCHNRPKPCNPTTAYAKRHSAPLHCGPPPLKGRLATPSLPSGNAKKPSPRGKGDRSVEGFCGTVAKRATRPRWMRFITQPLLHHIRRNILHLLQHSVIMNSNNKQGEIHANPLPNQSSKKQGLLPMAASLSKFFFEGLLSRQ